MNYSRQTRHVPRHARPRSLPVLPFLASLAVMAALVISSLPHAHASASLTSDALMQPAASARPAVTQVAVLPTPDPVVHAPVVHVPVVATTTMASRVVGTGDPSTPVPAPTVTQQRVVNPPPPPPAPTTGSLEYRAMKRAETRIGDWYCYGGNGTSSNGYGCPSNTFDCSGLVLWAYAYYGYSLPHSAAGQYGYGTHVSRSQLRPGDLVFFYSPIGHVGIYIGSGEMVVAPHTGARVQVQSIDWGNYVGATRI